jgi:hypothetical protein
MLNLKNEIFCSFNNLILQIHYAIFLMNFGSFYLLIILMTSEPALLSGHIIIVKDAYEFSAFIQSLILPKKLLNSVCEAVGG